MSYCQNNRSDKLQTNKLFYKNNYFKSIIMTKQSRKAIKAELIKEVSKQYKQKYEGTIKELQNRLYQSNKLNKELQDKYFQIYNENQELQDKVNKYEDWIQRLQEWCNLPENERTKAIAEYNKQFEEFEFSKEVNDKLHKIFAPYMNAILTTGF